MNINLELTEQLVKNIGELSKEGWFSEDNAEFVNVVRDEATNEQGISMLYGFNDTISVTVEQQTLIEFVLRLKELSEKHNRYEWDVRRQLLLLTAKFFKEEHASEILKKIRQTNGVEWPSVSDDAVMNAYYVLLDRCIKHNTPKYNSVVVSIKANTELNEEQAKAFMTYSSRCYSQKWGAKEVQFINTPAPIDKVNNLDDIS